MSIVTTNDKHYKDIAEALRETTKDQRPLQSSEMAAGVYEAHDKGYADGFVAGDAEGWERGYGNGVDDGYIWGEREGKQAEYDAFWNAFQDNGTRTSYAYGLCGRGWTDESFNPKYPIKVVGSANTMFRENRVKNKKIVVDFSETTGVQYAFYNTTAKEIGVLDFSNLANAAHLNYCFAEADVETIDKLILGTTTGTYYSSTFQNASFLKNIVIEGKINRPGLSFQWCPLTHDSLMSIINALEDYSSDTSGTVWTITLGSDNVAKLSAEELQSIRDKGWQYG